MKKALRTLLSMESMGIMILLFGLSIALATFIENAHGSPAARVLIYNAHWFEILLGLLSINMISNFFRYHLWKRQKLAIGVFHLAFVIMIIGAGASRYIGYEGMMHIREGESSNTITSSNQYITIKAEGPKESAEKSQKVLISPLTPKSFSTRLSIEDKTFRIKSTTYLPKAKEMISEDPTGTALLQLMGRGPEGGFSITLESGEELSLQGQKIAFNKAVPNADLQIQLKGDSLVAITRHPAIARSMEGAMHQMESNSFSIKSQIIYTAGSLQFVLRQLVPKGKLTYHPGMSEMGEALPQAIRLEVSDGNQTQHLFVTGGPGFEPKVSKMKFGEYALSIEYGPKIIELPFQVYLRDFQLERYPGSQSPSSYASEVTVKDPIQNINKDFRIYMNHVLKHEGYRFYQSSFDQDEKGTILSVNHDFLGMVISYTGYFLLFLGIFLALIAPGSRFRKLIRELKGIKKTTLLILFLVGLMQPFASTASEKSPWRPDKNLATEFGELWAQDQGGRMKPVNTLTSEIMRKLYGRSHYKGIKGDQVILGILCHPEEWEKQPIITVKNKELRRQLGIKSSKASFLDFVDFNRGGSYKLQRLVDQAYQKPMNQRNQFDKDLIKVDEKVNVFRMVQTGQLLRLFPNPADSHAPWHSPGAQIEGLSKMDSLFIHSSFQIYLGYLINGEKEKSREVVGGIAKYQKKFGHEILPSESHKKAELIYNKYNLFERLAPFYGTIALILLIIHLWSIMHPAKWQKPVSKSLATLLILGFVLHTLGLGIRWYVSGHAPLSNGYESMIYVSWASGFAGILFMRRSPITLPITFVFGAFALLVAHMSWINPEITKLVPVLKSYWLTFHVASVVASYGFLGSCTLLSLVALIMMSFLNQKNKTRFNPIIEELTLINQVSMIIGLYLLTIGCFLGAIWANESWGRYWSWDPKEAWCLVTILIYTFVAHMKHFPGMGNRFTFHVASVLAFSTVLMTYFGVNYYLGGMHSYAGGEAQSMPLPIYLVLGLILMLMTAAGIKENLFRENKIKKDDQNN